MGELLKDFLAHNKKDEETIGKSLYKKLLLVEEEIQRRKHNSDEAQTMLKENAINIKAVAESVGISRKTFYNNELLAKFVEENASVESTSQEDSKKLKERLADAELKLLKMMDRDIETETLRYQVNKLQLELENSYKRIQALEEQHEEDMREKTKPLAVTKKVYDA